MSPNKSDDFFLILPNGEDSICVVFTTPDEYPIQTIANMLREKLPLAYEVIPAYESITLVFSEAACIEKQTETLLTLLKQQQYPKTEAGRHHVIPVCYDNRIATDLDTVCKQLQLSKAELIAYHTGTDYIVSMLGFQPGFIYLDGLVAELSLPRKATPDLNIAPGSIAIGGEQTGIYSLSSPGGWWVIGQTPMTLFEPLKAEPMSIAPGDSINFEEISLETYQEWLDAS